MQTTSAPIIIQGTGLITGLPVKVTLSQAPAGTGIIFHLGQHDGADVMIPARLECIANTERGVTLGHPSGKFIAIVEHFLCACAFSHVTDLLVQVEGAPELPLLDGGSAEWLTHLKPFAQSTKTPLRLASPIHYEHNETTRITAVPHSHFTVSYLVDFDHPELKTRWVHWDSKTNDPTLIYNAQTFGHVDELPALQAQGLAKGVTEENTLGLIRKGGYTRPLRFQDEPLYHKALDLIGDLMLGGINALETNMHVIATCAGHSSHTAFAKLLQEKIEPAN